MPVPANVVIVPPGLTLRTRLLIEVGDVDVPLPSTATPFGLLSRAEVAGPPSPARAAAGRRPAIVVIVPPGLTLRTRSLFPASAM